jgi:hypothetical protein
MMRLYEQLKVGTDKPNAGERRKFEHNFTTRAEEQHAKELFMESIKALVTSEQSERCAKDFEEQLSDVYRARYGHHRTLIQGLFGSIIRRPEYEKCHHIERHGANLIRSNQHMQHGASMPLLRDVKNFVTTGQCSLPEHLVVGLHIFFESSKTFLWTSQEQKITLPNSRIKALSFANEVKRAVQKLWDDKDAHHFGIFPSNDEGDDAIHILMVLEERIKSLLSDKTFDLYIQSPWVAGSHLSAISDFAMFVGLGLLNHKGFFGAVLHMYNMLRQLPTDCPNIPILEHLCDLFGRIVFASNERPTTKFHDRLELFYSATMLKVKTSSAEHRVLCSTKKKQTHKILSNDAKIHFWNLSKCVGESLICNFSLSDMFFYHITGETPNTRKHKGPQDFIARYTPSDLILRAKDLILAEHTGAFPLAKVNFIAVFHLCFKILREITRRVNKSGYDAYPRHIREHMNPHVAQILDPSVEHVETGMRYVASNMRQMQAEQLSSGGGMRKEARKHMGLRLMRDAAVEVCEGQSVEDFFWKEM